MADKPDQWIPADLLAFQSLKKFPPGSLVFRNGAPNRAGKLEVGVRLEATALALTPWVQGHFKPGEILPPLAEVPVWGVPADGDHPRFALDIDMAAGVVETPGGYNDGQSTGFVSLGTQGALLHAFETDQQSRQPAEVVIDPTTWSVVRIAPADAPTSYTRAWRFRLQIADGWAIYFEPPEPPTRSR